MMSCSSLTLCIGIGTWTWKGLAVLLNIYTLTHCPSRVGWWCGAWLREPDPGSDDQIAFASAGRSARSSRGAACRKGPLYASAVERRKTWGKYGWEFMKRIIGYFSYL